MSKEPTIVLGEEYNQLLSFIGSVLIEIKNNESMVYKTSSLLWDLKPE